MSCGTSRTGATSSCWVHCCFSKKIAKTTSKLEQPGANAQRVQILQERAIELLNRAVEEEGRGNVSLKKEAAKLERVLFASFQNHPPADWTDFAYRTRENRSLSDIFITNLGISETFLKHNPDFLSIARERFWQHDLRFPESEIVRMNGSDEMEMLCEETRNGRDYAWKPWSQIKELPLDAYRIGYQGLTQEGRDNPEKLIPSKLVDSQGKYAIQLVTACPANVALPSTIVIANTGHVWLHDIGPLGVGQLAEVYSSGTYPHPEDYPKLGRQPYKTIRISMRNPDTNTSRILAGQATPYITEYLYDDDSADAPCLYAIINELAETDSPLLAALRAPIANLTEEESALLHNFQPISMDNLNEALLLRDEAELEWVLKKLNLVRRLISEGRISVLVPGMTKREKFELRLARSEYFHNHQHDYHLLTRNCTAYSLREILFAIYFLGATESPDEPIKVFENQRPLCEHRYDALDQARNFIESSIVHLGAAMPIIGNCLGTGAAQNDTYEARTPWIVRAFKSTLAAIWELLTLPFQRPQFPAAVLMGQNEILLREPTWFARLWHFLFRR